MMYVELKYLDSSVSITTQLKYNHRNWSTALHIIHHILEYYLHPFQALYIYLSNHASSGVFCSVNCNTGVLSCRLEYCSVGTDVHTSALFAECCILAPGAMHPHSSIDAKLEKLQRILEYHCAVPSTVIYRTLCFATSLPDHPYSVGHRTLLSRTQDTGQTFIIPLF